MIRLELYRLGEMVADQQFDDWNEEYAEMFAAAWANGLIRDA